MKTRFVTLLIIFCAMFSQAQDKMYSNLWTKVNTFEIDGLPKSALKIVTEIETLAKKNKNQQQLIKTLLFKSKFALILEEDAQLSVITDFKTLISKNTSPEKNILQNMLATLYWQYFKQNRSKFYNRTKTSEETNNDFRTWDLETLFEEIHINYQTSLKNEFILQQTPIKDFEILLHKQKNSKTFRPTLFDLLSHNALEFYKTPENRITTPTENFNLKDITYTKTAKDFANLKLKSSNDLSLQFHALSIYQKLILFHIKKPTSLAFTVINIDRLRFINQNIQLDNKHELFLKTYLEEAEMINSHKSETLYNYEIAQIYYKQGLQYNPNTNAKQQWKLKNALMFCNKAIKQFPKSTGAKKCNSIKTQIVKSHLQITTEAVLRPNQHEKFLINYKNLNDIKFSSYKLTKKQFDDFNNTHSENHKLKLIKKLKVEKTWINHLKNENDYQTHATELLLPKHNSGLYLIKAQSDHTWASTTIQFTDLAMVESEDKNKKRLQFIDRNNGAPITNANIELRFNYNDKKNEEKEYVSDKNGFITIKKDLHNRSTFETKIKHNNQTAYFGKSYINYYKQNNIKKHTIYQSFIFTDRSIYRPNQTLFFKAIALKTIKNKSEVLPNEAFTVELYHSNNNKITDLQLQTNEFGSLSGEFTLPNNGLNGQYSIRLVSKSEPNLNANHYFSVEEYKRPKFEIKFNPIIETFKINDSITVKGLAKAFAGSNITDAKVIYKVRREINYPRWYMWSKPFQNTKTQEITFGETTTNKKGEFNIIFKAIPDNKAKKENLPIFTYTITADVTDISGETRTTTSTVNVGYHSVLAELSITSLINKANKKETLNIDTKNLNGEFTPTKGQIKIYKLNAPKYVLKSRPWATPDYKNWTKPEFKTLFPHEAYANENNVKNWTKGKLVFNKAFNTEKQKTIVLEHLKKWDSGKYIAILTSQDHAGQAIKDEINFTLFSNKNKTLADNQLFQIKTNKTDYTVNDVAEISLATASNHLTVSISIEKNNTIIDTQIITLNKNTKTIKLPIKKEDLGGFVVHYSYAFSNCFMSGQILINVPYPTSKLEIETLTFRDKIQPGTNETWSFKIKGENNQKASAELLASMYDASLDQFKTHNWQFKLHQPQAYKSYYRYSINHSFGIESFKIYKKHQPYNNQSSQQFDKLNWFGLSLTNHILVKTHLKANLNNAETKAFNYYKSNVYNKNRTNENDIADETAYDTLPNRKIIYAPINKVNQPNKQQGFTQVKIRKNLQETAFFFPQLKTNEAGEISFNFTTPEALTKWNINLLAHNKKGDFNKQILNTVTQKELMILPNTPRFLREGDIITISSKIANLSNKTLNGQAVLQLFNALTDKAVDTELQNDNNNIKVFEVSANGNTNVSWKITIPKTIQAVKYKIIAKTKQFSDGEQNILPVLSNRMLVTESLPMYIKTDETRTFTLNKLKTHSSNTLQNHKLILEITSNPVWYAVQALPYLMEYPYKCNEQIFSRYYANILASHIAHSNPKIQNIFNQWKNSDALLSNLEKNKELKSILIQETPWLRDAQSETEQKKRIGLLFDLNKMNHKLEQSINKLKTNQLPSGGWSWFGNYKANRYITQHIITGFGHLKKLNVYNESNQLPFVITKDQIITKAITYLDNQFIKEYENLKRYNSKIDYKQDHLSITQLHYLYMRSFFTEIKSSKKVKKITNYYVNQIENYWIKRPLYAKGLMALISYRNEKKDTSTKILNSLKEHSITNDEIGMYWKENTNSYYWYQAPIETQSLLIEAFSEIENDTKTIDNLKIWLLKHKQTNQWSTTKSTTDAIYAILLQGSDWLNVNENVTVLIGNKPIPKSKLNQVKSEAGTGYYKTTWNANEITSKLAEVTLAKKEKGIAFGNLYWQYFEDLDQITSAQTPIKLKKQLFKKENTKTGEIITKINKNTKLKIGDLIRVRIELRSDRSMDFVHMKDMRAAGLEPVNTLSTYKYQDGLGYYESTKDASTNFFFDMLPKGIYIFEYDLRVNNTGQMSNGITTIQSMYAPEFSSHSKGFNITIID